MKSHHNGDGLVELKVGGCGKCEIILPEWISCREMGWRHAAVPGGGRVGAGAGAGGREAAGWRRGERLFSFGEAAKGVYLIVKGTARATLSGEAGRELMCRTAGAGSVLGLPSALCSNRYQFDVEALEEWKQCFCRRDGERDSAAAAGALHAGDEHDVRRDGTLRQTTRTHAELREAFVSAAWAVHPLLAPELKRSHGSCNLGQDGKSENRVNTTQAQKT